MDISDDKMNVYKDLARKCESFELFKWIVGDKESWMTEAGKAETETMLKTNYNGVHITDRQRLFVDMDGTLAEFKTVDTLETLYEKDYFINLKPNENVLGAIKQLIADNDIDVYILSAYLTDSRYALEEKNAWLDKYLPETLWKELLHTYREDSYDHVWEAMFLCHELFRNTACECAGAWGYEYPPYDKNVSGFVRHCYEKFG